MIRFRAALSLLLLALLAACGERVIASRAGDLSPGSFAYLRAAFYPGETDTDALIQELVELDAKGLLADRLGFRKDPAREKYVLLEKRRRLQKAAYAFFSRKLGERFSPAEMLAAMNVRPGIDGAVKAIGAVTGRAISPPGSVIVAEWPGGAVRLADLRETMLPGEWEQLLALGPAPLAGALEENLRRWAYGAGSGLLARETGADEDELARFDRCRAAALFLAAKYGFADEGIYPAKIIEVDLEPKELMLHFAKIRDRFLPLKRALVRYTAVKDLKAADQFVDALKKGEDFAVLAEKHAISAAFRATAARHYIREDAVAGTGDAAEARRFVLGAARQNIREPVKSITRYGVLVAQVLSTERVKKEVRYGDYISTVRYELNRELLRRQFPIDLDDMVRGMRVRIDRGAIAR